MNSADQAEQTRLFVWDELAALGHLTNTLAMPMRDVTALYHALLCDDTGRDGPALLAAITARDTGAADDAQRDLLRAHGLRAEPEQLGEPCLSHTDCDTPAACNTALAAAFTAAGFDDFDDWKGAA